MLVADRALLCVAALLAHGVEQVTAETRFGRLGRYIPVASNETTSTVVALSIASETSTGLQLATPLPPTALPPTEIGPTLSSSIVTVVYVPTVVAPPAGPAQTTLLPNLNTSALSIASPPPPLSLATSAHLLADLTTVSRVVPGASSPSNVTSTTTTSDWNATAASATDSVLFFTLPSTTTTATTDSFASGCTPVTNTNIITKWSVIYTSTITWTEDLSAYIPPFPPISTPTDCTSAATTTAPELSQTTNRLSVSICDGSGENCTPYSAPNSLGRAFTGITGTEVTTTTAAGGTRGGAISSPTLVVFITDKNPAVIYSTSNPPDYGDTGSSTLPVAHNTAIGDDRDDASPTTGPAGETQAGGTQAGETQTPSGVTIVIQPTQVVINGHTITDDPQSKTTTLVIGTDTFVVDPTDVVGAGATLVRPVEIGGVFVSTPSTTTVEGLQVVYGPSVARIDGTVFTLGATPTTAVVKGQTITLGPAGIAFASQTIPAIEQSGPTEVAVLGAELLTAIGSSIVVIKGTTITYGPDSTPITQVVNGDTVIIGPSGVTVHNLTLGGTTAAPSATTYEIVGGATVTEVGSTAVIIGGTTFFVGSGVTSQLTTVIGGATLTIGAGGVSMSTFTFSPYATTTTGVAPGSTSSIASATSKDAGPVVRPNLHLGIMGLCIAFGAGFLGQLLY